MALMWMVCKPFGEGKPAPQQEWLEQQLGVPGDLTRRISDKLILHGLLNLAGPDGDLLTPGRSLDLISVSDALYAARKDEDQLGERLPGILPDILRNITPPGGDQTFSELVKTA